MTASIRLAPAPANYDQRAEQEFRTEMERRDQRVFKRGQHLDMGGPDFYVVLYSPDGARWAVTVDNSGVLSASAL